jgi:hypothetical protein
MMITLRLSNSVQPIIHTTYRHEDPLHLRMERPAPSEPVEREVTPLPSIDRGRQAWSFVAAGFAIETLLWGGLFSTGVFLKYYAAHEVGHYMVSGEACIVKLIAWVTFWLPSPSQARPKPKSRSSVPSLCSSAVSRGAGAQSTIDSYSASRPY